MKEADCIFEKKKWISITGLCNNNCLFCLDSDRLDKEHKSIQNILSEIDFVINCKKLIISGGEPTIHPQIIEIVEYAKEKGFEKIQIVTNGRMLSNKDFCEKIIKAGLTEVTFSIHGIEDIHDKLTNVPGSFKQIIKGIRNVKRYPGIIINTDTCITKVNHQHLLKLVKFMKSKSSE